MMNTKTIKIVIVVIVLLALAGISSVVILHYNHKKKPAVAATTSVKTTTTATFIPLSIQLHNGEPVHPAATYLVKPGTGLQFTIDSNIFGKVGVPTDPSQIITFTSSPLVFKFKASMKPGNYPLSYQPDGSKSVIQIGLIVVR